MISLVCKCSLPVSHNVILHDLVEKTIRHVLLDVLGEEMGKYDPGPHQASPKDVWNEARAQIIQNAKTKYGIELEEKGIEK